MIGILTEKPSACRNFAKALGGMSGTYNGEQYVLVNARGHLFGFIDDVSKQVPKIVSDNYKSWNLEYLPWNEKQIAWKYGVKKDAKDTLKVIKDTLKGCDEIVIGTDDDPTGEGELLAWEIISNLKLNAKTYSRMFFEDESEPEIQKAFKNRKVLGHSLSCMYDDPDYKQALFRTKWDYLSMQWTRVVTNFSPYGYCPRQGRLKSAMVKLVGDQLELVKNYVKKPYFQVRFKDENGVVYTSKTEPQFDNKNDAPIEKYVQSPVICDKKEMKNSVPPKFLDLATLGSILAPKGVPAKTVIETYQKMYEAKVVSYPRTEDKCITAEQFNALLPLVDRMADLVGVDTSDLTHRTPRSTHVKTGMAHGANRPGSVVPRDLDKLDDQYGPGAKLIYVTLAKNYLATLCEDYIYEKQTGHIKEYPKFVGQTNVPKSLGWKKVCTDELNDEDDVSRGLGAIGKPFVYEGANPKPKAPTMKWLMLQLGKYNVGTGSTRTSIYADVTNSKSKYPLLVDKKGKITMAPNGEMSYKLIPNTYISNLKLTETVMEQMKNVKEGKTNGDEYLAQIKEMIKYDIEVVRKNSEGVEDAKPPKKEKHTGIWKGKEVSFSIEWCGHRFTEEECEALCNGETITIDAISKAGKSFTCNGKLKEGTYKKHKYVGFEPDFSKK